jgi:hypothetical protein
LLHHPQLLHHPCPQPQHSLHCTSGGCIPVVFLLLLLLLLLRLLLVCRNPTIIPPPYLLLPPPPLHAHQAGGGNAIKHIRLRKLCHELEPVYRCSIGHLVLGDGAAGGCVAAWHPPIRGRGPRK